MKEKTSSLTAEAKSALAKLGRAPKKRFGQNFMVSEYHLDQIASAACPHGGAVVEIGPGLGFLTRALLKAGAAPVIAIEKDRWMAEYLRTSNPDKNLKIVESDILTINLKKELQLFEPATIAGNIPYNITSPILEWIIGQRMLIDRAVLTVQHEVALRITASPGSKAWGALSVFLQFYADVSILSEVPRQSFYPCPNVDSAIVMLNLLKEGRVKISSEELFFRTVRRAFQKRRKTILNALADESSEIFSKTSIAAHLVKCTINPIRRPETLSIQEWAALSDKIHQ